MKRRTDHYPVNRTILGVTRWSLVRRACTGGKALDEWAASCWYPLYVWARRKECSPEDAADAVQEFLAKICSRGLLAQADPARGKFRSWLLSGFGNHLNGRISSARRLKRGGGAAHLPLTVKNLEQLYQNDMTAVEDSTAAYTRAWALTLMDEAMARLEEHFASGGRESMFEALLPSLEQPLADSTYQELAARLGLNAPALRQAAVRFRQRYRRFLLDVAGERLGITCEARLAEELRDLLGG